MVSVASCASALSSFPSLAPFGSLDRLPTGDWGDGSDVDLENDSFDCFGTDSSAAPGRLIGAENDSAVRRGIASRMKRLREGLPYVTIFRGTGAAGPFCEAIPGLVLGLWGGRDRSCD